MACMRALRRRSLPRGSSSPSGVRVVLLRERVSASPTLCSRGFGEKEISWTSFGQGICMRARI